MEQLRREVDRVLHGFGLREPGLFRSTFLPGRSARGYPLINVAEDGDAIHVEALAPGLVTDSIDVSVKGDVLTISGEKRPLEGFNHEAFHRSERATGKFIRNIQMSTLVDSKKVKARYKNGILSVTLPKAETAKAKRIEVSVR
jgi:HSP20 family protein